MQDCQNKLHDRIAALEMELRIAAETIKSNEETMKVLYDRDEARKHAKQRDARLRRTEKIKLKKLADRQRKTKAMVINLKKQNGRLRKNVLQWKFLARNLQKRKLLDENMTRALEVTAALLRYYVRLMKTGYGRFFPRIQHCV